MMIAPYSATELQLNNRDKRALFSSPHSSVRRCPSVAQESPFFVTYPHYLKEPGNLEIEASSTTGVPRSGQRFYSATYLELEYGVTAQWTSELYLEGQSTWVDSTVFTGWRLENRFKPLHREHWINPVLYLEYEDLNEASRIQKKD